MVFLLSSSSLLGCAPEPVDDCTSGASKAWVMRSIEFARFEGEVAGGFDLDGDTGKVCGHADWASPWGEEGVDNNLARLIPALEATEAVAVEAIVQQTINSGELLLMVGADHVDSFHDDSCVEVEVLRGVGPVEVGTDELLLPGQTLGVDPTVERFVTESSELSGGVLSARGFSLELPFQVFDVAIHFDMSLGQLRMEVDPDTLVATGYAGGGVEVEAILDVVNTENVDPEVQDLLNPLLASTADLDMDGDGVCEQISMALRFEAVPVWLYE